LSCFTARPRHRNLAPNYIGRRSSSMGASATHRSTSASPRTYLSSHCIYSSCAWGMLARHGRRSGRSRTYCDLCACFVFGAIHTGLAHSYAGTTVISTGFPHLGNRRSRQQGGLPWIGSKLRHEGVRILGPCVSSGKNRKIHPSPSSSSVFTLGIFLKRQQQRAM